MLTSDQYCQINDSFRRAGFKGFVRTEKGSIVTSTYHIHCFIVDHPVNALNGIMANDSFSCHLCLEEVSEGSFELTKVRSHIVTKTENRYMSIENKKVPFRKSKGDFDKILKALDKYAQRAWTMIQEEGSNLYDYERLKELDKGFI